MPCTTLASWRSGYAADCKSRLFPGQNKDFTENRYQDKARTQGEPDNSANPRKSRGSFGQRIRPEYKSMSRMLGYCLTLGTADAWSGFTFVAAARLSEAKRAALAFASLNSLEPEHAEMTAAASIGLAGAPLPSFLGGMEDARLWASHASRSELKAYALAAYEAMSAADQAAFFRHISEVEVAA
ncbi:MAG: hypothetical protein ACP5DX_12285 [Paracoccaceae bacterium]